MGSRERATVLKLGPLLMGQVTTHCPLTSLFCCPVRTHEVREHLLQLYECVFLVTWLLLRSYCIRKTATILVSIALA